MAIAQEVNQVCVGGTNSSDMKKKLATGVDWK
jgi:hypothetical protein